MADSPTHYQQLLRLSLPILITQICQMGMGVADTLMTGRFATRDLAAVGIGTGIWIPLLLLIIGIMTALTASAAQLHGQKNYHQTGHVFRQAFWVSLCLGLFSFLVLRQMQWLLELLAVSSELQPLAMDYLNALSWGAAGTSLFFLLRHLNEGLGNTLPVMLISIIGVIINIILNYFLIFGSAWLPPLGAEGAGWATAITQWLMALGLWLYVLYTPLFRKFNLWQASWRIDSAEIRQLFQTGIPIGIAFFIEGSIFSIISLFLAPLGNAVVAAHQITLNIASMLFMLPLSFSQGVTILTGYAYGARHYPALRQTLVAGYQINLGIAAASMLLIFNYSAELVALYSTQQDVVQTAVGLLFFVALFQIPDALQLTSGSALRGLKDTRVPMLFAVFSFWICGFPLGYILAFTPVISLPLGAAGFWMAFVLALSVSAALLGVRLFKRLKIIRQQLS